MREDRFTADELEQHPAFLRLLDFMDRLTTDSADAADAADSAESPEVSGRSMAGNEAEEAVRGLFGSTGKALDPFSNGDDDATEGFTPDMLDDDALEELPW